ncbi:hypothetical protein [Paraconexibacter algicola]|uniref:Uncharacterized protein n=1 Tax=Paraconexibacter algicola TaxID=2133960 RepID=A0A2T4UDD7_9ACTN|nr:hypothetical protein [Paraconexibacter algicola]PTL55517.1 hypothetical protein C7Y72_17870 [Paraconexibacter algicola]
MSAINGNHGLSAAMDAWDAKNGEGKRSRRSMRDAAFLALRAKALANPRTSNLARVRLTFRGDGLTIAEAASRALVSERTWKRAEAGEGVDDLSWARIARALECDRATIDPTHIPR